MSELLPTLHPIFLARLEKDADEETYNKSVAENEQLMNQNYRVLYEMILDIERRLT